ncbi:uncharacterized protein LOC125310723 [Alosa alosa]|uniref:uncharacterized protein LOC125310723 n=1 Tax=Alosa alosa TaxID=278164 RepID=UPI002015489A|nr:uncharacterized protein LOC125310723 [Alosa alosa]
MAVKQVVGNMEKQLNPSAFPHPCSLDSSPEVDRHGLLYEILQLTSRPKDLDNTTVEQFSCEQTADYISCPGDGDGSSGPDAALQASKTPVDQSISSSPTFAQQDESIPSDGTAALRKQMTIVRHHLEEEGTAANKINVLMSDRVLGPLVKPLVDQKGLWSIWFYSCWGSSSLCQGQLLMPLNVTERTWPPTSYCTNRGHRESVSQHQALCCGRQHHQHDQKSHACGQG